MQRGAGLLAGRPTTSIEVRILPDRWGTPVSMPNREAIDRAALGPTCAGEIVVSGDHVVGGYLDGAGDADTKIHAGDCVWHRTGDAGYFDRRGRLWLLGRCAARAIDDGGILYPFAVECRQRRAVAAERFRAAPRPAPSVIEVEGRAVGVRALMRRLAWAPRRCPDRRAGARRPSPQRENRLHGTRGSAGNSTATGISMGGAHGLRSIAHATASIWTHACPSHRSRHHRRAARRRRRTGDSDGSFRSRTRAERAVSVFSRGCQPGPKRSGDRENDRCRRA